MRIFIYQEVEKNIALTLTRYIHIIFQIRYSEKT